MLYFQRRIYETLVCHVVISVIFAGLFYFNILQQGYKLTVFMLGLAGFIDIGLLVFFSSIYYKFTEEDTPTFYKTNTLALLTLVIPANLFALLDSVTSLEPVYTFLFFPFKLGTIAIGMSKFCSALVFSAILILIVLIIPIFLRKVYPEEVDIPPMMVLEENNESNEKKVSE